MASIEKRGSSWTVRWWEGRGDTRTQRRVSRIPSRAAALDIQRRVEAAVARGEAWRPDQGSRPSYEDVVVRYAAWVSRSYAPASSERMLGTLARYLEYVHGHRRGTLWLDAALDRSTLEAWHDTFARRGLGQIYANQSVLAVLQLWEWCEEQPDLSGWVGRVPRIRLPSAQPMLQPDAPSWDDMDACIRELGDHWMAQVAHVMRSTGLRCQQVMHLTWEHVDLDRELLTIVPGLQGSKSRFERRGRVVPLAPVLVEELAGWGRREGWLVARGGDRRTRPDDRSCPAIHIRSRWERTDVRPTAYRQPWHCFRKGFVTGLAVLGVDKGIRSHLTGHASDVHGDTYTVWRLLEPQLRDAVAKIPAVGAGNVVTLDQARKGEEG